MLALYKLEKKRRLFLDNSFKVCNLIQKKLRHFQQMIHAFSDLLHLLENTFDRNVFLLAPALTLALTLILT